MQLPYKELTVWQKSMDLTEEVYRITALLPKTEVYGLCSQLQRAAVGIPSNIAEGSKRGVKEFIQFLTIASGSAAEVETQLLVAQRLYTNISFEKALALDEEILKMLFSLIKNLRKNKTVIF
jgi:four helix bundle protein